MTKGLRSRFLLVPIVCFLLIPEPKLRAQAPEEPDFFFLTGGPYTQGHHSPQIIWGNQWSSFRGDELDIHAFTGAGRFEFGITARLEFDIEFGVLHVSERGLTGGEFNRTSSDDVLLGVRYRLLTEQSAPFTLTVGPQILLPVANFPLGSEKTGYAVDVTAAKDWGGLFFAATSLNLIWVPGVELEDPSLREIDLTGLGWAAALGWRIMEKPLAADRRQDIHGFLEVAVDRLSGEPTGSLTAVQLAPGIRYGFINSSGILSEVGVSFPFGLNKESPDWGVILQIQVELPGN